MIRAAVIGAGSMGRNHARVYAELEDAELVGVADINQEAASRVASRYGVPAYSDYRVLLEEVTPDAVTVAVPTALHREIATAAMEAGAHVLVEKPIAATLEEGQQLIEQAHALRRQLMVGHIVRFSPAIQALKRELENGRVGRIFQIVCRRVGPFPSRIRDVGVVVDLATHDLDVMRFLVGQDPVRVYAETERQIHTAHEDLMLGLLRFPDGVSGCLEINWLTPTKVRDVLVVGERGMLRADDLTQDLFFYENAQANGELWAALRQIKGVSEGQMIRYAIKRYEPLWAELHAFVQAIAAGHPVPVSGEDGLAALRLALALVESGKTHRLVSLE
jgi:UDP-N-acetylglucosamine 3-dehydrogenase